MWFGGGAITKLFSCCAANCSNNRIPRGSSRKSCQKERKSEREEEGQCQFWQRDSLRQTVHDGQAGAANDWPDTLLCMRQQQQPTTTANEDEQ